jgi:hypothetical protein
MRQVLVAALTLQTIVLVGCNGPPTSTDLDVEEALAEWRARVDVTEWVDNLEVGRVVFGCRSWASNERPPDAPMAVDIVFGGLVNPSGLGPAPGDVESVIQEGGVVLHQFAFPGVRAILRPKSIERLVGPTGLPANHALGVPDSGAMNFRVAVGHDVGLSGELATQINDLGGVVTHTLDNIQTLLAVVPEAALVTLAASAGVRFVEVGQIGCLDLAL